MTRIVIIAGGRDFHQHFTFRFVSERQAQDYLGHRDPKHTAHYTRVAGHRSK